MAPRNYLSTSRNPHTAVGKADAGVARVVFALLLLVPLAAAWWLATSGLNVERRNVEAMVQSLNPKKLLGEDTASYNFLPPPVAALPPEPGAAAPAEVEVGGAAAAAERVKVVNTDGLGAILRAEPQTGRQIATLRDGQVLQVLERTTVGDSEWVRVRTPERAEGWIYGGLVEPAQ